MDAGFASVLKEPMITGRAETIMQFLAILKRKEESEISEAKTKHGQNLSFLWKYIMNSRALKLMSVEPYS